MPSSTVGSAPAWLVLPAACGQGFSRAPSLSSTTPDPGYLCGLRRWSTSSARDWSALGCRQRLAPLELLQVFDDAGRHLRMPAGLGRWDSLGPMYSRSVASWENYCSCAGEMQ